MRNTPNTFSRLRQQEALENSKCLGAKRNRNGRILLYDAVGASFWKGIIAKKVAWLEVGAQNASRYSYLSIFGQRC